MRKLIAFVLLLTLGFAAPSYAMVNEVTARNDYVGDGVLTAYTYSFKLNSSTQIEVFVNNVLKVVGLDYTVGSVGADTGTITFTTAPPSGQKIAFIRKQPLSQLSDYILGESFPSARVELDFDKVVMALQMLNEVDRRSIKLPKYSTLSNIDIPLPGAGKVIRWNTGGTALETVDFTVAGLTGAPLGQILYGNGVGNAVTSSDTLKFTNGTLFVTADAHQATTVFGTRFIQNVYSDIVGLAGGDIHGVEIKPTWHNGTVVASDPSSAGEPQHKFASGLNVETPTMVLTIPGTRLQQTQTLKVGGAPVLSGVDYTTYHTTGQFPRAMFVGRGATNWVGTSFLLDGSGGGAINNEDLNGTPGVLDNPTNTATKHAWFIMDSGVLKPTPSFGSHHFWMKSPIVYRGTGGTHPDVSSAKIEGFTDHASSGTTTITNASTLWLENAPNTGTNKYVFRATAGRTLYEPVSGAGSDFSSVLTRQVTGFTTLVNTTTATDLFTYTLKGGILGTDRGVRITALGEYLNNSAGVSDLVIQTQYAGQNHNTTANALAQNANKRFVYLRAEINATGATNTQSGHSRLTVGAIDSVGGADRTIGDEPVATNITLTVDSTADQTLRLRVNHSVADANISFVWKWVRVELL